MVAKFNLRHIYMKSFPFFEPFRPLLHPKLVKSANLLKGAQV
jgi:hypothetical protein